MRLSSPALRPVSAMPSRQGASAPGRESPRTPAPQGREGALKPSSDSAFQVESGRGVPIRV